MYRAHEDVEAREHAEQRADLARVRVRVRVEYKKSEQSRARVVRNPGRVEGCYSVLKLMK